jgi:hypothetical protein
MPTSQYLHLKSEGQTGTFEKSRYCGFGESTMEMNDVTRLTTVDWKRQQVWLLRVPVLCHFSSSRYWSTVIIFVDFSIGLFKSSRVMFDKVEIISVEKCKNASYGDGQQAMWFATWDTVCDKIEQGNSFLW